VKAQESGFGQARGTLPGESGQPRIAGNASAQALFGPSVGALELDSPVAQAAIAKGYKAFGMESEAPGLGSNQNLRPHSVEQDSLGMTHVRFDRCHEGIPVLGEQVIAHLGADGEVASTTGDAPAALPASFEGESGVTAQAAIKTALAAFSGTPDEAPTAQKVFAKDASGTYHAAYVVTVNSIFTNLEAGKEPVSMRYVVDAKSSEIVDSWNAQPSTTMHAKKIANFRAATGTPARDTRAQQAAPDDTSLYSGKVSIDATKNAAGQYVLRSVIDGVTVTTLDAQNKTRPAGPVDVTDDNNSWGEATDNDRQRGAVDAHFAAITYVGFLRDVLGRNSIDNKGMPINSFVHIGRNYVNAFYTQSAMHYGDGDGRQSGPLTTLDIGGHEPGHAVIDFTSGLEYRGQSGGGNEGFADIIGFGLEWYAAQTDAAIKWDFTMGEDAWTPTNGDPTDGLRYMDDPTKDGYSVDHLKNYPKQTEVHGSSGIVNKAFAMAVKGGTNKTSGLSIPEEDGIGPEKALKAFARGYTLYCTPTSDFEAQWKAVVQGAIDLYGKDSKEVQVINAAWNSGMRTTPPTGINV